MIDFNEYSILKLLSLIQGLINQSVGYQKLKCLQFKNLIIMSTFEDRIEATFTQNDLFLKFLTLNLSIQLLCANLILNPLLN